MSKPTLAIVGAGKVGSALALALQRKGYPIVGISSRSLTSAKALALKLDVPYSLRAADITPKAQIVFITTPDREVARVTAVIAHDGGFRPGQLVVHTSGSLSYTVLERARQSGAIIGGFHPLQSFADLETAIANLPGAFFALEGEAEALPVLERIMVDLQGRGITIKPADKALYHAAAVVASNYLVTIIHMATEMLGKLGVERSQAVEALSPLIMGTIENIKTKGTVQALTGPVERGDISTLQAHLSALTALPAVEQQLYKALGRLTVEIAQQKGSINPDTAKDINKLLGGKIDD